MNDTRLLIETWLKKTRFSLKKFLFPKQGLFISDPAPFKVAVCSRRSGKTTACAAHMIHEATNYSKSVCLYITLSRNNAKKIIWPTLLTILREYSIQAKVDQGELSIKFDNGSVIYLSGANDKSEINKFRGLALKLVYVDECQSFPPYIEELVDDVITPALMDYAGTLNLIGTPGPVPSGYFHKSAHIDTWSAHSWNFFDNPFIQKTSGMSHAALLDRELKRRGVTIDDPTIQREWFGKWIIDTESLLLNYSADRNHFDILPQTKSGFHYIFGIDIGFVDADAVAVLAYSDDSKHTYLVEEVVKSKLDISKLAEIIANLSQKYPAHKMVIDEGGLGKKIAEEFRKRFGIPVEAAEKTRKMENYSLLNDALRRGVFKAHKDSRFAHDSYLLEVDRSKSTPDKIRVKDSFHSDIVDAVLYAFRESPAYAYQQPIELPKYGSPEWAEREVSEMEKAAEEHFKALEESEAYEPIFRGSTF